MLFAVYKSKMKQLYVAWTSVCFYTITGLPTQINNIHKVALYKAEPFLQW